MKNSFAFTDIFNDTSYMTFPKKVIPTSDSDFWTVGRPETRTGDEDSEIILKTKIDSFR